MLKKHLSHEYKYKREVTLPVFIFLTHYKRKLLVMYSGANNNAEVLHSYFLAKILGAIKALNISTVCAHVTMTKINKHIFM